MRSLSDQEWKAVDLLEDRVRSECMQIAMALATQGLDAVNEARLLLCRRELELYKTFSRRYRAGDSVPMEALLSGAPAWPLRAEQVKAALDAMEVAFDDWGDELASDAATAVCNLSENLTDFRQEPVAALARGMEMAVVRLLGKAYVAQVAVGGAITALVDDYVGRRRPIPGLDGVRDLCRAVSRD